MFTLKLKHHFDAAHKLKLDYNSPCTNLHGHRWEIEIEIKTDQLVHSMVVDFTDIKRIINTLDHCVLNEVLEENPTAENICKYLYKEIDKIDNFDSIKVTVWESPEASITYED